MVECNLAKVEVAGSNPVSRSRNITGMSGNETAKFDYGLRRLLFLQTFPSLDLRLRKKGLEGFTRVFSFGRAPLEPL